MLAKNRGITLTEVGHKTNPDSNTKMKSHDALIGGVRKLIYR